MRKKDEAYPGDQECEIHARYIDDYGIEHVIICTLAAFHNEDDSMHYDGRYHVNWEYDG